VADVEISLVIAVPSSLAVFEDLIRPPFPYKVSISSQLPRAKMHMFDAAYAVPFTSAAALALPQGPFEAGW